MGSGGYYSGTMTGIPSPIFLTVEARHVEHEYPHALKGKFRGSQNESS